MLCRNFLPVVLALCSAVVRGFSTNYTGPASSFPAKSQWLTYDQLLSANSQMMIEDGDTSVDITHIDSSIKKYSAQYNVDPRVILCMIMEESGGFVAIKTEHRGLGNAGLMQCGGCPGFEGYTVVTQAQVDSMVEGGVQHFVQNIEEVVQAGIAGTDPSSAPVLYAAMRLYNSGSIDYSNLSDGLGATFHYVSDMANRLLGEIGWF